MIIKKADFILSGTKLIHFPNDNRAEILFCGRSNVGKSSFINALVNRKNLARISSNPGKTQTLNFYLINDAFYLVDCPGYGYAKVSKGMKEAFGKMIEEYLVCRHSLRYAFLLVDYRHEPTNDDKLMYDFLKHHNIPVCIIATKKDKLKNSELVKNKKAIYNKLGLTDDVFIPTSSQTGDGIKDALAFVEKILNSD